MNVISFSDPVEDLIAKGIDGLILNPKDAQGLVPVTKKYQPTRTPNNRTAS
jgi:ABC-type sugar transport system substrate-binding protein